MSEDRSKIIGGSDIAGVMGLSRWKTPLALWAEKTGKLPIDELANFEAKEIGIELEEYVSRKFERKTGIKLRRDSRTFKHPKYEYMVGHIDRMVLDGESIFEAKTTSAWNAKEWADEDIPQEYVLQCQWYCGLAKRERAYIAVLIGGNKFVWKEIKFDEGLFQKMVESAKSFMGEFILKDIPPIAQAGDDETLFKLFPKSKEITINFDGENAERINNLIEERAGGVQSIKEAEKEVAAIEAQIKQFLGEAEAGETNEYRFSWKTQSRQYPDTKRLKADGLLDQYSTVSSFRILRTSKKGV